MKPFVKYESKVRSYIRSFPTVFDRAEGSMVWSEGGEAYIDFFAGAGTLNYGHNPEIACEAMISYLQDRRIVHGLDKATVAKRDFLETLQDVILKPRDLDYKIQFVGPTGTNAVETALKLARMSQKRSNVLAFTNAYHGLTLGALAVTGNDFYRDESYGHRVNVDHMPYDGFLGEDVDTIQVLRRYLTDKSSGVDLPSAIIVETVQGEGGINVASCEWLRKLEALCREFEILLIIDDIQMGNGRTGWFFSFEEAGLKPDMVCLSKSLGGGLPIAILLIKPELDIWQPGEHTGTFRGNNLAFVGASELMRQYWKDSTFAEEVSRRGQRMGEMLKSRASDTLGLEVRGRGMVWGIEFENEDLAAEISTECFNRKLICETCGSESQVLKLLPALTIEDDLLDRGMAVLGEAIETKMGVPA